MRKKTAITEIISQLELNYPDAECSLTFNSPLQLLVATILSAQCTDRRVNQVTATLFQKYENAEAFAAAPVEEMEQYIRATGFYRNKAKSIIMSSKIIAEKHNGKVPQNMEELLELPGVARKTANCVLGNAFGKADGIVVDTHVKRIANRLGLTKEENPVKIEKDLIKIVPPGKWINFSHLLIHHGRQTCKARKPDCINCFLSDFCRFNKKS